MNPNRKGIVPKGTAARGTSTCTAWTLAQGAIHSGRGMVLAILVLGPIVGVGLIPADRVTAQTFTTLHSFTALSVPYGGTNSDGAFPNGGLITNSTGNTLYGTAVDGGSSGNGTVFAVNTDGTGFTNLHSFTASPFGTNSDGVLPYGLLVLSGNTLYGTAYQGGSSGNGTLFALNTDGTGFTNLHSFTGGGYDSSFSYTNSDGANIFASLILSGATLYGAAWAGGTSGNGTLFAVNTDGTGFTNLHSFTAGSGSFPGVTNSDGAGPSGLMLSGTTLYGAAVGGGSSSQGTVFKLNLDGTGFTNLHSFTAGGFDFSFAFTNSEGAYPIGGLILAGNTLYGTANQGGRSGNGSLFAVNTDGTGFTNLHSFTAVSHPGYFDGTNSDGGGPYGGLTLSGNTLYGTANLGGSAGNGTVFTVNTDGTGFTTPHSFAASRTNSSSVYTNSEGAGPIAGLILSGNTLYGTASGGGSSGNGTVFSLSFRPQLTITPSGPNVILSWPTSYAGFDFTGCTLQSAPAITGTFTNLPAATSPYTNPISGAQQFFRLIH